MPKALTNSTHYTIYLNIVLSIKDISVLISKKEDLNDLVLVNYIVFNSSFTDFEANKLHLLFQATYYLKCREL